jgi:hypothetical protein
MRRLARNWDLAVTSAALAMIVSCVVAPRVRQRLLGEVNNPPTGPS